MSELSEAINEMRNMRESYDQLSAAAEAYNTGKTELAQNITAKGVTASASETLPELAEKVSAIAQESYTIDGGEMYAKQLYGSLTTPNYWNLYEVLANLLSDGRLVTYGGILLAEYYKGYDSLALVGAGAGGAYVVSDLDENGQFKMYTEDTTHTWATEFDGKGNRWVAYCFADEYHDFQITDTNTSPRSIFIGRKVGTITCLVNTRISQIVVPDGNELEDFVSNSYTHNFGENVTIRNINKVTGLLAQLGVATEKVYLKVGKLGDGAKLIDNTFSNKTLNIIAHIDSADIQSGANNSILCQTATTNINYLYFDVTSIDTGLRWLFTNGSIKEAWIIADELLHYINTWNNLGTIFNCSINKLFIVAEKFVSGILYSGFSLDYLYIGYKTNDKTKEIKVWKIGTPTTPNIVELQDGICKNITINGIIDNMVEANIYTYILQRLKQDEPNCGSGVTITLGSTNLAKLTSEESQDLLAELRGTYGYTFA